MEVKKFIKQIFLFLLLPACFYMSLFIFLRETFEMDLKSSSLVILGDSQTQFINGEGIANYSVAGSPYFVQYRFAKEFINELKGKRVYVSFNYHNLSDLYQNRLENDKIFPGWRNSMASHIEEFDLIIDSPMYQSEENFSVLNARALPNLIGQMCVGLINENTTAHIRDTLSINETLFRHWQNPDYVRQDEIQRTYLIKLVKLLKANNCEVTLLKMPLTKYYYTHVPEKVKHEFEGIQQSLQVGVLDLDQRLMISKDYQYFKDYSHLNKYGCDLVKKYFSNNEMGKESYAASK
ncbi:hypothetical protein LVD15_05740 [Fulvivirga maritima]|uniref:hypothetical protein n=1 Tax=Fulvivirga maritima TaxID=2904247 RepID=UPI001F35130F|nr:hypothetical protein [Fulvivirga maritima]UII27922.1 hypothetical protein LVD15_05740 [Fulvivirga maritima]